MIRPRVGLVLGGGGSRGLAHIGVLDILVNEDVPIDLIVGTSMGAIVGTLFALGVNPKQMVARMGELKGSNLFSMNLFSARARQRMVRDQLAEVLEGKTFADLKIPLSIMAVDMVNGHEVVITEGPLMPAVLASSAVPAVFPPVEINDLHLADGGVIVSLATHVAFEKGADKVIAVDVYPPLEKDDPWIDPVSAIMGFQLPFGLFSASTGSKMPSMLSSIWRGFRVMAWYLHEERLAAHPPDVLLRPKVDGFGSLDFTDVEGPYLAGLNEAQRRLPEIKMLFEDSATRSSA